MEQVVAVRAENAKELWCRTWNGSAPVANPRETVSSYISFDGLNSLTVQLDRAPEGARVAISTRGGLDGFSATADTSSGLSGLSWAPHDGLAQSWLVVYREGGCWVITFDEVERMHDVGKSLSEESFWQYVEKRLAQ